MQRIGSDPPTEQRKVERPLQVTHVGEPHHGFILRLAAEGLAAHPEDE
jgi:hypothetical protein